MVAIASKKLAEKNQMKLTCVKNITNCQAGNPHFTIDLFTLIFVYQLNKLTQKLTKYTSYKVRNLGKVVPNNNVFGGETQ